MYRSPAVAAAELTPQRTESKIAQMRSDVMAATVKTSQTAAVDVSGEYAKYPVLWTARKKWPSTQ